MLGLHARIDAFLGVVSRHAPTPPRDLALVLSGAAFRNHLFTPDDNHAWREVHPDRAWLPSSLDADNYGAFESLSAHTGWTMRRYPTTRAVDLVVLLLHETEEGRTPLFETSDHRIGVIERATRAGRVVSVTTRLDDVSSTLDTTVDPSRPESLDALREAFPVVQTVRPVPDPLPVHRRGALVRDVLQYALQHGHNPRELVHHEDAWFATGCRAWTVLSERLAGPDADLDDPGPLDGWIRTHVRQLAEGRAAAASVFRGWSRLDDAARAEATGGLTGTPASWDAAGEAWARTAGVADAALAALEADAAWTPRRLAAAAVLRAGAESEATALDALEAASGLHHRPSPFA